MSDSSRLLLHGVSALPASPLPHPLLRKGFRPFFLASGLFLVLALPAWLLSWSGQLTQPAWSMAWHAHEMLYGFAAAVIAGFLLTAVGNWTSRETLIGYPLAALACLWLLGRISWLLPSFSPALRALIDTSFLPLLALSLLRPILLSKNFRNLPIIGVLLVLSAVNAAWHYTLIQGNYLSAQLAQGAALDLILLLIILISGRVFPMFTRNALKEPKLVGSPHFEKLSVALMLLMLVGQLVGVVDIAHSAWIGAVGFGLLALSLTLRSLSWASPRVYREPLLWVLHLSNAWLIIGMALRAGSWAGWVSPQIALHALTVGVIATVCFGMMARVSLGHTGRLLQAPLSAKICFWLLACAGIARVFGPLLSPSLYSLWVHTSGICLALAALSFTIGYLPILGAPRIDGKPG